jgi:hypothetical protein
MAFSEKAELPAKDSTYEKDGQHNRGYDGPASSGPQYAGHSSGRKLMSWLAVADLNSGELELSGGLQ